MNPSRCHVRSEAQSHLDALPRTWCPLFHRGLAVQARWGPGRQLSRAIQSAERHPGRPGGRRTPRPCAPCRHHPWICPATPWITGSAARAPSRPRPESSGSSSPRSDRRLRRSGPWGQGRTGSVSSEPSTPRQYSRGRESCGGRQVDWGNRAAEVKHDHLEPARQEVFDRASREEQAHYLELMRHDPVAGMAYLEALALKQQTAEDWISTALEMVRDGVHLAASELATSHEVLDKMIAIEHVHPEGHSSFQWVDLTHGELAKLQSLPDDEIHDYIRANAHLLQTRSTRSEPRPAPRWQGRVSHRPRRGCGVNHPPLDAEGPRRTGGPLIAGPGGWGWRKP